MIAVEFIKDEFLRLLNNIIRYKFSNILAVHSDIIEYLTKNPDCIKFSSCLFFDPPWGGPNYKKVESLELYFLGPNSTQLNVVSYINSLITDALIVLKCPENTNLSNIKTTYKKVQVIFAKDRSYNLILIHKNINNFDIPNVLDCVQYATDQNPLDFSCCSSSMSLNPHEILVGFGRYRSVTK